MKIEHAVDRLIARGAIALEEVLNGLTDQQTTTVPVKTPVKTPTKEPTRHSTPLRPTPGVHPNPKGRVRDISLFLKARKGS